MYTTHGHVCSNGLSHGPGLFLGPSPQYILRNGVFTSYCTAHPGVYEVERLEGYNIQSVAVRRDFMTKTYSDFMTKTYRVYHRV